MNYSKIFIIWWGLGAFFTIFFATPVFGSFMMAMVAELIGCEMASPSCVVLGVDLSDRFEPYSMVLVSMLVTPMSFWYAFYDVLIIWFIILLGLYYKKRQLDKQLPDFK